MTWDLRLGKWQDALADVGDVDCVITDPPYSERTHRGHDDGAASSRFRPEDEQRLRTDKRTGAVYPVGVNRRRSIEYAPWSEADVNAFVDEWSLRCRGWFVVLTDHVLAPMFAAALAMPENGDRYVFAPLPIVETGSRVRLTGDGPSSWTCWMVVARPRSFNKWGTLPGAYIGSGKGDREHIGGKDSGIMRAIVRDYSRPGDLVCDPCAGAATTGVAALMEGRRFIGAEMDPVTYEKARKRLSAGYTPPLFVDGPKPTQQAFAGVADGRLVR